MDLRFIIMLTTNVNIANYIILKRGELKNGRNKLYVAKK
mgnify:CR=1 FL=1